MGAPNSAGDSADIGSQAMSATAALDEVSTIAAAQTVNGLSTLLVSEGLAKLLREMMGPAPPAGLSGAALQTGRDAPGPGGAPPGAAAPSAARSELLGISSQALGELLTRSVVNRIVDLNTVNTYLALATSEQLRQWGRQAAADSGAGANGTAAAGTYPGYPGYPGFPSQPAHAQGAYYPSPPVYPPAPGTPWGAYPRPPMGRPY